MRTTPNYYKTMDYSLRWGIEPMFSDFKTRGFGLEETQLEPPERVSRLILILSFALHWVVFSGMLDASENPLPYEKKPKNSDMPATILNVSRKICHQW
jgi:hypothetical protein